jgi:hypothetical protein
MKWLGWSWGPWFAAVCVACGASSGGAPPPPVHVANGTIDGWQAQTKLTTPRANHCSVVVGGWLVVIGGNYKPAGAKQFENLDDVLVAKIGDDGSLGDWSVAGHTPSPVNSCTAAAGGGATTDLYLVDGIYDSDVGATTEPAHHVRKATLADDGTLGAWSDVGLLPVGMRVLYSSATVQGGMLAAFHAKLPMEGDAISLAVAGVAATGTMAIDDHDWLKGFRGHPQYAFGAASLPFAYALGGYDGSDANMVQASGAGVHVGVDMRPDQPSFPVTPLPKPTAFGQAVAVDDWVFVVGGKDAIFAANGRPDVFTAHVQHDGTLGAWATLPPLPQGRTSHAVAVGGDFLYVTGGGYDAGGLDTVFSTRVRFQK